MTQHQTQMSFKTARKKLKQYYRVIELAEEYQLHSADIIICVSSHQRSKTSPEEAATIRRIDLLARVQDTEAALGKLPPEYREYLGLRFAKEMSVRQAGRQSHKSHSSADRFEGIVLGSFISALGFIAMGDREDGYE